MSRLTSRCATLSSGRVGPLVVGRSSDATSVPSRPTGQTRRRIHGDQQQEHTVRRARHRRDGGSGPSRLPLRCSSVVSAASWLRACPQAQRPRVRVERTRPERLPRERRPVERSATGSATTSRHRTRRCVCRVVWWRWCRVPQHTCWRPRAVTPRRSRGGHVPRAGGTTVHVTSAIYGASNLFNGGVIQVLNGSTLVMDPDQAGAPAFQNVVGEFFSSR